MPHFTQSELITYISITRAADWPKLRANGDGGRKAALEAIAAVQLADGYLADVGSALDAEEAKL